MRWLTDLWFRALALVRGSRLDEELQEEIAFHLEMETEKNLAAGMPPDEARRLARRHLGGEERVRLHTRDAWGVRWAQELLLDLRYGVRSLKKTPGVTLSALAILAVGVGATTALFGLVEAVLLRPLPYSDPERLVAVWETHPDRSDKNVVSRATYVDWSERSRVFESLGAYYGEFGLGLVGDGDPVQVRAGLVTPSVLTTLGVDAALGRAFSPGDAAPGRPRVVLLSDGFWHRRFAADPAVLGTGLTLDGIRCTVVGVLPPGIAIPSPETEVWLPLGFSPEERADRKAHTLRVVARLGPGVSLEAAQEEMSRLTDALATEDPELTDWGVHLVSLHDEVVGSARPALAVLLGASGLLLALGCVNVANLLLARSLNRGRELAVRQALGASRSRLVRQLLTESLALGLLGGAAGLLVASWAIRGVVALRPEGIPRLDGAGLDPPVFLFAFALALATSLLFGVLPAIRSSRADAGGSLHIGTPATVDGRDGDRALGVLVVAEVALSLVLLVGAGLLGRSLLAVERATLGFAPEGVLTVSLNLPESSYQGTAEHAQLYDRVLERIRALPGVARAAGTSDPPLIGAGTSQTIVLEDDPEREPTSEAIDLRLVTEDTFRTLGMPLVAGRSFGAADRADARPVLVVNEAMARRYWPDESPLGKRIAYGPNQPWVEVVGVVGATRYKDPEVQDGPAMYAPYRQKPWPWMSWMTLLVKTDGDPQALAEPVRQAIWEIDADLPILATRSVEELAADALARRRFHTTVFALFAGVALLLGVLGLYGVLAFSVERRRREIGIRMALGARKGSVTRLVLGRGAVLAAAGIALGTVVALALSQLLAALLYGIRATDPATFTTVALLLGAVALVACLAPLRRALRIDPARVLK